VPAAAPAYLKTLAWIAGALLIATGIWWIGRGEASPAADAAAWQRVSRSGDTTELKAFMADFPDSDYLPQAERLLETWRDSLQFSVLIPVPDDATPPPPASQPKADTTEELTPTPVLPTTEEPDPPAPTPEPAPATTDEATTPAEEEAAPAEEATSETADPILLPSTNTAPAPITPTTDPLETVDYRMAATKPLHPDCWEGGGSEKEQCTRLAIMNAVIQGLKSGDMTGMNGASCKLSFIISKTGAVSGMEVISTDNEVLSDQVSGILAELPNFIPGRDREGEPIDVRYTLPVRVGN